MNDSDSLATYKENFPEIWEAITSFLLTHGEHADDIYYENVDWNAEDPNDPGVIIISAHDQDSTQDLCMHHEDWVTTDIDPENLVHNLNGLLCSYVIDRNLYPWIIAYKNENVVTLTAVRQGFTVVNSLCAHVMPHKACIECNPTTALKEFNLV